MASAPAPVQAVAQPSSGVGSVAETNRLLGGNYFDTNTGAQTKPFTPTVVTDANVREKVIPQLLSDYGTHVGDVPKTTPGQNNGGDGGPVRGADGKVVYDPNNYSTPGNPYGDDILKSLSDALGGGGDSSSDDTGKAELALLEKMKSSSDAATAATIDSIQRQYADAEGHLVNKQNSENKGLEHALLLGGGNAGGQGGLSRYAPGSAANLTKLKSSADVSALLDLHNKENTALANARTAKTNKDYQTLQSEMNVLKSVRAEKLALAKQMNASLIKQNTTARTAKIKASRDAAIVGLVGQGVTDPKDLLSYLNYDERGNQTGDFTVDEITKTLKNIAPAGNLTGLSGNVKSFYALKDSGRLPGNIADLPEDQQLYGYLQYLHSAIKVSSNDPKNPSVHKLTIADVKSLGLPTALIGESEKSIIDSFKEEKPPQWFVDKLSAEQGNDNYALTHWQEFQKSHINPPAKSTSSSGTNLY